MLCVALPGFGFRFLQKLTAEFLPAQVFPDSNQVDNQPVPIGRADHPADDLTVRRLEDEAQVLSLVIVSLPCIEIREAPPMTSRTGSSRYLISKGSFFIYPPDGVQAFYCVSAVDDH
ncbi:MAG TPA: hypothetical protein DF984_04815 [Anaerolineaceae bacterium]|nr:hypothetical protein [Anaerolineaceae bacterium]